MKEQIEEKNCKECLHYEMCLKKFRKAKNEGLWELTEEDEYFAHADECDFYAAGYRKQKEERWIVSGMFDDFLKCSSCGYQQPWQTAIEYKFCPNCGAKMKGGAE